MDERDVNNPQDTRKIPIVRDGVSYTPGGGESSINLDDYDFDYDFDPDAAVPPKADADLEKTRKIATPPRKEMPRRPMNEPRPKPVAKPVAKTQAKPRKAPNKANYTIFLVTTVFVGIIAMVILLAILLNQLPIGNFGGDQTTQTETSQGTAPEEPIDQPPLDLAPGDLSLIGLVHDLNQPSGRINIYLFDGEMPRAFFVASHTILRDKFGNAMTFSEFRLGDVVEIVHAYGSTEIETARISAQVDNTYREFRDVLVDAENNLLRIGLNSYTFGPRTIVMYHGELDDIANVTTADVVTVTIFRGQVAFVDIIQGSGTIHIPENDMIIQGTVEVANTTFTGLDGEMEIRVPEGDHRVIIRGLNIEDFQYELTVERGGLSSVSLDGLELLAGSLTINVEDPYVSLTIDGEEHLTNYMIMLEYGTYTVSVTREGFVPFIQEVTIDSANHEITVVLEEIIHTQNVTLTTSPPGARMYLDGEYVGLSPVNMELELRRYSVTMALQGFVGGSTDIWVTENTPIFSWWLQNDPGFVPQYPGQTPSPAPGPTPAPPLYPDVAPSPSPSPFFP